MEMEKNPTANREVSPKDKQLLIRGLMKAVIGLLAIVILLVGTVLFAVFYTGPSPATDGSLTADSAVSGPQNIGSVSDEILDGKDVATGLVVGEGVEIVRTTCTGCHSSAIILQNRFTREGWKAKIVWMQETQGLWDLGENEPAILDYLATHYAPEPPKGRRIPLKDIGWYELGD